MPWALVSAIGGVVIASLTIVCAGYLLVNLTRHSRGKLRIRLLIGIVTSDLIVGMISLPPEAMFVAGRPLVTGSRACSAQAFIYTATLFSQNLWTLVIACATYMLLKHPLNHFTTILEHWSLFTWPIVWGVSILHSCMWHAIVGWENTGTICYYGTHSPQNNLDRHLMQLLPRAMVFVVVTVLYSRLFSFLRRPDTVALGSNSDPNLLHRITHPHLPHGIHLERTRTLPHIRIDLPGAAKFRRPSTPPPPRPPWEDLEFISDGQHHHRSRTLSSSISAAFKPASPTHIDYPVPPPPPPSTENEHETNTIVASPFSSPTLHCPSLSDSATRKGSADSSIAKSFATVVDSTVSIVPTLPKLPSIPSQVSSSQAPSLSSPPLSPHSPSSTVSSGVPRLTPRPRIGTRESFAPTIGGGGDKENRLTFKEFFNEHPSPLPSECGDHDQPMPPQISASAYLNRQASILMLWLPLAYMIVFSVSLVRLVNDMVADRPNPALRMVSGWMILAVGLVDASVYGLAELIVRRRVRRVLPYRVEGIEGQP